MNSLVCVGIWRINELFPYSNFRVLEMEATPYDYLLTALGFTAAQVNLY